MSALERFTDALARAIAGWVVQRAHPVHRDWALAMHSEMDAIDRPASRLRWAAGSLTLLGTPAPAGGPSYFGPLARNLLAFTAFVAALRFGMLFRSSPEDWVVSSSVIAAATLVWWLVALALRADFMSYAGAGQAIFGVATLAAHLTFGIKAVQGGEIYFSIMGAATLSAVCVARQRGRGASLATCVLVALGAAALNEGLWIFSFGLGRFANGPNQITIVTAALLGAAAGLVNVARLGPDRPFSRVYRGWMRRSLVAMLLSSIAAGSIGAQARWTVDPTPLLDVKGLDAAGKVVFGAAAWATRLRNGTVVIADASGPALHFVGGDGKLLKSTGRMGQGPGDFRTVTWVAQCGEDGIFAWDFPQMRVTTYDESGTMKKTFPFGARGGAQTFTSCNQKGMLFAFGAGRRVPPKTPPNPNAQFFISSVVATGAVMSAAGDTVTRLPEVSFGEMLGGMIMGRAGGLPRPLGATTAFALGADRLYLGDTDSASIAVISLDGKRVGTIPITAAARPLTSEQYAAAVEVPIAMYPVQMRDSARAFALRAPRPERAPPFSKLFVDPSGALWVVTSVPGDKDTQFLIYAADGRLQARASVPVNLKVFEVGADYILGARDDTDGEPHVAVFKVSRGGRP